MLVVLACAFPAGYFFWWATACPLPALPTARVTTMPSFVPSRAGSRGRRLHVPDRGARAAHQGAGRSGVGGGNRVGDPDKINANYGVTKSFERVHNAIPHGSHQRPGVRPLGSALPAGLIPVPANGPRTCRDPSSDVGDHGILDADLIRQMKLAARA